jgi:hypothetical protein
MMSILCGTNAMPVYTFLEWQLNMGANFPIQVGLMFVVRNCDGSEVYFCGQRRV